MLVGETERIVVSHQLFLDSLEWNIQSFSFCHRCQYLLLSFPPVHTLTNKILLLPDIIVFPEDGLYNFDYFHSKFALLHLLASSFSVFVISLF